MTKSEQLHIALLTEQLIKTENWEGLKSVNKELLEELRTERARLKAAIKTEE